MTLEAEKYIEEFKKTYITPEEEALPYIQDEERYILPTETTGEILDNDSSLEDQPTLRKEIENNLGFSEVWMRKSDTK